MFQFPYAPPAENVAASVVGGFVAIFVMIELAFQASDLGWLPQGLRWSVYADHAFIVPYVAAWWEGIDTTLSVPLSFLTHAFLHGGMLHLVMNCAVFLALGVMVTRIFGLALFLFFFVATAVGGALAVWVISGSDLPVVGASGVVFGLFGVLKAQDFQVVRAYGLSMRRFMAPIVALALINLFLSVGMAYAADAGLAWEAHLGGFLTGFVAALPFVRLSRVARPDAGPRDAWLR